MADDDTPVGNGLTGIDIDTERKKMFARADPDGRYRWEPAQYKHGVFNAPSNSGQDFVLDWQDAVTYSACGLDDNSAANVGSESKLEDWSRIIITRGEMPSKKSRESNETRMAKKPIRWETAKDGMTQFCTTTLFPVKFTRIVQKQAEKFMLSYYCIYSSMKIKPPNWQTKYRTFNLVFDTGYDGNTISSNVNVDTTLINDESAIISILASCQNSYVKPDSYITFIPRIQPELFQQSTHWATPSRFTIGGASMGLAVFAAIKGWIPILYTGYLNAPVPGGKFVMNHDEREIISQNKYGTSFNAPVDGFTSTPYDGPIYGVPASKITPIEGITNVMAQPNFVETVSSIFSKIMYAVYHKIPIMIPMQSDFRLDMVAFISKFRNEPKAIQWMGMVPSFYTAAMMEDGFPMLTRTESGEIDTIPNIIMPLTMTDASCMQMRLGIAAHNTMSHTARVGYVGGANRQVQYKNFEDASQRYERAEAANQNLRREKMEPERKEMTRLKLQAKEEKLNVLQKFNLINPIKEQFHEARVNAKKAKKAEHDTRAAKIKTDIKQSRAGKDAAKTNIRQSKKGIEATYREAVVANPDEKKQLQRNKKMALIQERIKEQAMNKSGKKQYARDKEFSRDLNHTKIRQLPLGGYSEQGLKDKKRQRAIDDALILANRKANLGQRTAAESVLASARTKERNSREFYRKQFEAEQQNRGARSTVPSEDAAVSINKAGGIFGDIGNLIDSATSFL